MAPRQIIPRQSVRDDHDDEDAVSRADFAVLSYQVQQLEKRLVRVETFILGVLGMVGLGFMGALAALLKLPHT